ncbi:MAG: trypsin-like peptidase domain-containing protein [Chlorobi bacterium]|nr:trypsin-like peptidase domain-containing protein [Chlorobiota bacterium]MCI0714937.1 trypsin-like peptidase domain-containing protein [Chlorobiota bacterium]
MTKIHKFLLILLSVLSVKLASQELSADKLFELVNNSVVVIVAYDNFGNIFQGSGVVIDKNGLVATNHHVCRDANRIEIKHYENEFKDVEVVFTDELKDILILRVNNFSLSPMPRGTSTSLKTGQRIYAIGSPEGYENSISDGIISGFRTDNNKVSLIQMTTPITEGSSGGAVVNARGELIGICVSGQHEGNLYFAIPINEIYSLAGLNNTVAENNESIDYYQIGTEAYKNQNYEDAEFYFSKYLEKFSSDVGAYYNRGYARFKLREFSKAINDFSKVIEFNLASSDSYFYRGNCYYSIKEYQKAYSDYTIALEKEPDNPDIFYNRGYTLFRMNKYPEAIGDWQKAVELNSSLYDELSQKIKIAEEQLAKSKAKK